MTRPIIPTFDGHNDLLYQIWRRPEARAEIWAGSGGTQLSHPAMQRGGFAGGMFALYVPSPVAHDDAALMDSMAHPPFALPLDAPIDPGFARQVVTEQIGHLMALARGGDLEICTSVAAIRAAMAAGRIAAVLHLEGAEAIGPDLDMLYLLHALGLRSLGPVWSRPTIFGHGVPFAAPAGPDMGPGLTPEGHALIAACADLGIAVDLSHLNEAGFWDVARSGAPLIATHSNAHAVTACARNLTDAQLRAIGESGGMAGLNFGVGFLHPEGARIAFADWDPLIRHLDHMIALAGEDHVGIGSDFDGALTPLCLPDAGALPDFWAALARHGYGADLIARLARGNWLAALARVWREDASLGA